MIHKSSVALAAVAVNIAVALALAIYGDIVIREHEAKFDDYTVAPGPRLVLINNAYVSWEKNFRNDGLVFLTCTDGFEAIQKDNKRGAYMVGRGDKFVNNQDFIYDHSKAHTEALVGLFESEAIENQGNMWFKFGGNKKPEMITVPDGPGLYNAHLKIFSPQVVNDGKIMVSSVNHRIEVWMKNFYLGDFSGAFTNNGLLCLQNAQLLLGKKVTGTGCITVGRSSLLNLVKVSEPEQEQTIYMDPQDSYSKLFLPFEKKPESLRIAGFRRGAQIYLGPRLESWTYEGDLFTANFMDSQVTTINLGPGYDSALFELDDGSLTYTGEIEITEPPACHCNYDAPPVEGKF